MASNYPASLDTTATLPAAAGVGANLSTFPHSALHGNADDAIIAIETELGVAPSDTFSTVKARLDSIAAKLALITPIPGTLTSWTPTIFQPGSVAVTNVQSHYMRIGRWVTGFFSVSVTGTGTANNTVEITGIPATANAAGLPCGNAQLFDASANLSYLGHVYLASATAFNVRAGSGLADPRFGATGSGFVVALASGDTISGTFAYEANAD